MGQNIFLDTSIFVKENFLEGKRIEEFLRLSKVGSIQLVLSQITVNEIKARFKKQAKVAIEKHNLLLNDREMSVLRNDLKERHRLVKFPKIKIIAATFDTLLDAQLAEARALIIPYPTIDSGLVFKKYFEEIFPFNTGEKKNEFPDAFALISVEEWCSKNKTSCIIFSKDKDFLKSKPARGVNIEADYEAYLDTLLKNLYKERVDLAAELFKKNDMLINNELTKWIRSEVDDDTIYYDFTNSYDVHDIKVNAINIIDKEYQLISVDEEIIEVEATVTAQVKITLTIDDEESGIYDSEEGEMLFMETADLEIEQELEIPVNIVFNIINKNDYDEKCEIVEINKGKPIILEPDSTDLY